MSTNGFDKKEVEMSRTVSMSAGMVCPKALVLPAAMRAVAIERCCGSTWMRLAAIGWVGMCTRWRMRRKEELSFSMICGVDFWVSWRSAIAVRAVAGFCGIVRGVVVVVVGLVIGVVAAAVFAVCAVWAAVVVSVVVVFVFVVFGLGVVAVAVFVECVVVVVDGDVVLVIVVGFAAVLEVFAVFAVGVVAVFAVFVVFEVGDADADAVLFVVVFVGVVEADAVVVAF